MGSVNDTAPLGSPKRSLLRNAGAYLLRGFATGIASLALPALLLRSLPSQAFLAWVIVVQIASYVSLLESGLQVSIGRFIAQESARADQKRMEAYYFAGLLLLAICMVMGLLATGGLILGLPILFPKLPVSQLSDTRQAILWVSGAAAVGLPASAATGVFIGLERNSIPATLIGGGRIVQCLITAAVAYQTHSLVTTAVAYGLVSLAICIAQFLAVALVGPGLTFNRSGLTKLVFRDLAVNAGTLSLWTVSMLMVSGLDVPIVAWFDFRAVAPYSFAASLISVFVGFVSLAFNAILPRSSALVAVGNEAEVRSLMINSTRICAAMVLGCGVLGYVLAPGILHIWLGEQVGVAALPLVRLLILANAIRMLMVPFALILVGTGRQWLAGLTPIAEATSNVAASLLLAWRFGAAGVAMGTIVGSCVGVGLAVGYSMLRASEVCCSPKSFFVDVVLRIGVLAVPSLALIATEPYLGSGAKVVGILIAGVTTYFFAVKVSLNKSELEFLEARIRRLARTTP